MTLRECLQYGEKKLEYSGVENFKNDTRLLAMFVFGYNYSDILMHLYDPISDEDVETFKNIIELRSSHYPCQYIIGKQEFMGFLFKVTEDVLIPRQETELLVEQALFISQDMEECKILDVCCGSGCIGISYNLMRMKEGHNNDTVCLLDISKEAVIVANENKTSLGAKCDIIVSDLFENVDEKYDMIISNPPYICTDEINELMEEVRCYEPMLALDGRSDGLYFYKKIIEEARKYLYEDGKLLFEIGCDQYESVRGLLIDAGFSNVTLKKDYAGLDRVVVGSLT